MSRQSTTGLWSIRRREREEGGRTASLTLRDECGGCRRPGDRTKAVDIGGATKDESGEEGVLRCWSPSEFFCRGGSDDVNGAVLECFDVFRARVAGLVGELQRDGVSTTRIGRKNRRQRTKPFNLKVIR